MIPFPSIRIQLLLVSLVILILPLLGVQNIRAIEDLLKAQQVLDLDLNSEILLKGVAPFIPYLQQHHDKISTTPKNSEIYVNQIDQTITIDGYADDWPDSAFTHYYESEQTSISLNLSVVEGSSHITLLFDIKDDVLYQTDDPYQYPTDGDHIVLKTHNLSYIISSNSPGWLSIYDTDHKRVTNSAIKAELQPAADGYIVEISLPTDSAHEQLSFAVIDRDNADNKFKSVLGNTTTGQNGLLFREVQILSPLENYIRNDQQLSVIDSRNNILFQSQDNFDQMSTEPDLIAQIINRIIDLIILAEAPADQVDHRQIKYPKIFDSADSQNDIAYRYTADKDGVVYLSLAKPVVHEGITIGTLILKQSTHAISTIRYQALFSILVTSLIAIVIIAFVLLFYARFLIKRIRRINSQLQDVVNDDGKLKDDFNQTRINDEIGELNRGIVDILGRLREYQRYMESLASKLSHEIRTPLTVVQSSLENLHESHLSDDQTMLLDRADDGLKRLKLILSSLTEASRLETALKSTERSDFNLVKVAQGCVDGYQHIYPGYLIIFDSDIKEVSVQGAPELIAQLLDKLVSNAIDFHESETPITVSVHKTRKELSVSVCNQGIRIPDHIRKTMFDSMISQRQIKDDQPHLGLGLYIVKLISDFHGTDIQSDNTDAGVCFKLRWQVKNLGKCS